MIDNPRVALDLNEEATRQPVRSEQAATFAKRSASGSGQSKSWCV